MIWKRVVLDRTSGTNFVVTADLKGIDRAWDGKVPVWKDVKELETITLKDIEEIFLDKVTAQKVESAAAAPVNKKKSLFSGEVSQKLFIILSKMPKAPDVIHYIANLKPDLTVDNLQALIKNWPEEINDLMEQYNEDPTAEWEKSETFFIELGKIKKMDFRIKLWLFKINYPT